jgi:hypothetical protein
MSTEIVKSPQLEIAAKLNGTVARVIGQKNLIGFEKAYIVANAISELKAVLTPEYMKPIMELQGNRLGFKTDKIYTEDVVKNCLIEAVLFGIETTGNQFNIIGGNFYATKEGLKKLLDEWHGLTYNISFGTIKENIPNWNNSIICNVPVTIEWKLNEIHYNHLLTIQINANKGNGFDAVIGKATRKASKWLFDKISGTPIPEGEIEPTSFTTESTQIKEGIKIEEVKTLFMEKKDKLTPELIVNAEKIINNKETQSYQKLLNYLKSL